MTIFVEKAGGGQQTVLPRGGRVASWWAHFGLRAPVAFVGGTAGLALTLCARDMTGSPVSPLTALWLWAVVVGGLTLVAFVVMAAASWAHRRLLPGGVVRCARCVQDGVVYDAVLGCYVVVGRDWR